MKILFVDMLYDYGKKERGINYIGQYGFKQSLEALGHEVVPFYYDDYLNNTKALQTELINFADQVKPDLIFFILFQDQFKIETLEYLKSRYITFNWFGDDSWRFNDFTARYANSFTFCSTTDKFSFHKYIQLGQNNIIMSQWAVINTPPPESIEVDYEFDVSFIGGFNHARDWFLKTLKKRGIKVEAFGNGWPNGMVSLERMNEIFLKSKINLNLSNSKCFDIRYVLSHPLRLAHTLKTKKDATQIKARHFEIPYNGGFQLSDYSSGLEEFYDIGKDVACYKDIDEASTMIEYYLNQNNEREAMKKQAFEKAVNSHTYMHRLDHVIQLIKKSQVEYLL